MLARLLILFLILGGQAAYAQSPKAPMPIYGDRLAPGWDNWRWAKVELSAKLSPTATTTPIKVDAGPWAAVFLHHAEFSTAGYKTLTLWVNGGVAGGQTLSVVPVIGDKAQSEHAFTVTPEVRKWTKVEIPLSTLGIENKAITGFWIQNASDSAANTFYLDQIALF